MGRTAAPILLSSLLYFAQTAHGDETKQPEINPFFSLIPWDKLEQQFQSLYFFDFENAFFFMQRNWACQLESCPLVCGVPFPVTEPIAIIEPPAQDCVPCCCSTLERVCSTFFIRHIEPGGIGYAHGYTTLEALLFPLSCQGTRWPFIDLRAHYFNNNEWAGNVGLGARFLTCSNVVYGVNSYFDFRTKNGLFFTQIGAGFERLGPCWDFRINGYFPIKRDKTEERSHFTYPEGFFIDRAQHRAAPTGVDMEIGRNFLCCDCIRLYTGIGPYYYGSVGCKNPFVGGRLRLLLDLFCHVTLESIFTYDSHYKTRIQGGLSLNFPFGCCSDGNVCQGLLSQPIWRNEIIPLEKYCKWRFNF